MWTPAQHSVRAAFIAPPTPALQCSMDQCPDAAPEVDGSTYEVVSPMEPLCRPYSSSADGVLKKMLAAFFPLKANAFGRMSAINVRSEMLSKSLPFRMASFPDTSLARSVNPMLNESSSAYSLGA